MGTIATSDIVSVSEVTPRQFVVTMWTAEGDPVTVGTFREKSTAAVHAANVARAVRSWQGARL